MTITITATDKFALDGIHIVDVTEGETLETGAVLTVKGERPYTVALTDERAAQLVELGVAVHSGGEIIPGTIEEAAGNHAPAPELTAENAAEEKTSEPVAEKAADPVEENKAIEPAVENKAAHPVKHTKAKK